MMRKFILGTAIITVISLSGGIVRSQAPQQPPAPGQGGGQRGQRGGAAAPPAEIVGPQGPVPYDAVENWLKPFDDGFTFGAVVGVLPESANRILVLQRGSTRLPNPIPAGYEGNPQSAGITLTRGEGKVWKNVIFVVDGNGKMIETWSQWDSLFARTDTQPGVHRIRISPYDRERRVWVIDESAHQIHVFSNDGKKLLMSLGEKDVTASDNRHFGKPQDVAFMPDGRVLVADGLGNARVVVLDASGKYLTEFGSKGTEQGQFMSVHGITIAPDGLVITVDRDGRQVQLFRESAAGKSDFKSIAVWKGFELPLDAVIKGENVWISDLGRPKVVKLDLQGNRLYTWLWPTDGPARFREMHTLFVDSAGVLYGADQQVGRVLKLLPKKDADPKTLIR